MEEEARISLSISISLVSLASSHKGTVAFHAALDLEASSKILLAGPWAPFPPLSSLAVLETLQAVQAEGGQHQPCRVMQSQERNCAPGAGSPPCQLPLHCALVLARRGDGGQRRVQCRQLAQGAFGSVICSRLNNSHS